MTATQLELELWDQLQQAQQMPEAVDVAQLLNEVEAAAAQLPETQRLQFAGDALLQIAELCAVRAEVLMIQWEELVRDPIVEQGFFADVVRQAMAVDLSDLIEPARSRQQIAYSEDVASWTAAILEWLQTTLLSVSIAELSDSLEMLWIEVWLGVLFGGFQLEQRGSFMSRPFG